MSHASAIFSLISSESLLTPRPSRRSVLPMRKSRRFVVCGFWFATACSIEAVELEGEDIDFRDGPVCEPTATEEDHCEDQLYRHPFVGVQLIDGKIPGLDLKDASPIGRYAVHEEGGSVDGNHHEFSGITILERRRVTEEERAALRAEKGSRTRENTPTKLVRPWQKRFSSIMSHLYLLRFRLFVPINLHLPAGSGVRLQRARSSLGETCRTPSPPSGRKCKTRSQK